MVVFDAAFGENRQIWRGIFPAIAAEPVSDGRSVVPVGARHYVHEDQPELVIAEIRNMLTRVRTGAWPSP